MLLIMGVECGVYDPNDELKKHRSNAFTVGKGSEGSSKKQKNS
jgi:hypothetical protein